MASVRGIKKDIDYLVEEVLSDSMMIIYFHPERKDKVIKIMEETVAMRNDLIHRANNPAEKRNKSLVRKHYAQIRREMFSGTDDKFNQLSTLCKK